MGQQPAPGGSGALQRSSLGHCPSCSPGAAENYAQNFCLLTCSLGKPAQPRRTPASLGQRLGFTKGNSQLPSPPRGGDITRDKNYTIHPATIRMPGQWLGSICSMSPVSFPHLPWVAQRLDWGARSWQRGDGSPKTPGPQGSAAPVVGGHCSCWQGFI